MSEKFYIPEPPKEVFAIKAEDPSLNILRENRTHFVIEKITYDNGILIWYKGAKQPRKGFPTVAGVSAINIAKKMIIESVRTFGMWQFAISIPLIAFTDFKGRPLNHRKDIIDYGEARQKSINKILSSFNKIVWGIVSPYVLKPEYMTGLASELQGLIFAFMIRCGLDSQISKIFCTILGSVIEYDNAYRYRLEDIFTETTKEALQANPKKEIKRLISLYCSREKDWGVAMKFKTIHKLVSVFFWIPKVKQAFIKALDGCEFKRLQFDDIDRYWCNPRSDYDFFGESYTDRMKRHEPVQGYRIDV